MNSDLQEERVEKSESIKRGIYILPNLVTTGSLFAGFYSLVSTLNGNYSAAPQVSSSTTAQPAASTDTTPPVTSNTTATPNPAPVGTASITLTATDSGGQTTSAAVTLLIGVNAPPLYLPVIVR